MVNRGILENLLLRFGLRMHKYNFKHNPEKYLKRKVKMNKKAQMEEFFDFLGALFIILCLLLPYMYIQYGLQTKKVEGEVMNIKNVVDRQSILINLMKIPVTESEYTGLRVSELIMMSIFDSSYENVAQKVLNQNLDPLLGVNQWEIDVKKGDYEKKYGLLHLEQQFYDIKNYYDNQFFSSDGSSDSQVLFSNVKHNLAITPYQMVIPSPEGEEIIVILRVKNYD